MRYQLKSEINGRGLLETIYANRNLDEQTVNELLNANKESLNDPFEIFNMDKAVEMFKTVYRKDMVIGLIPDADVDGMTSSSILYQFLTRDLEHPMENIVVFFQEGKQHGLSSDIFPRIKESNEVDLYLIADSSSNDKEQLKELSQMGKIVILLDHHQVVDYEEIENVVIVNNQLGDLNNKGLCGAGVVAKFIEAMGYNVDKYLDLVAVGLVADSMNMVDMQNRAYVNLGLSNIKNPLLKAFFKKYKNVIIENVGWNCANFINSVIRYGTYEQKVLLWDAIVGKKETVEYVKKDGTVIEESLQEHFIRVSDKVKSKQNRDVKNSMGKVEKWIHKHNYENDKVIIVVNDGLADKTLGGLVAQKLCSKYTRPILILAPFEDELSGSARSPLDLRDILNESGLVTFANGHARAFGVSVPKDNIEELRKYLNNYFANCDFVDGQVEEVDYIFDSKDLKLDDVKEVGDLRGLWGKECDVPKLVVKKLTIESSKIQYKKDGICYVATFTHNGITYKKEFCSRVVYEEMQRLDLLKFGKSHTLDITLLVEFKKDDKGFYYVAIKDFNSVKSSKLVF